MATFDEFYASLDPDVGIRGKQFEKFVKYNLPKKRFPSGFPQENVCYYGFKHVGITTFMTALFLGTIEWE